MNIKETEISNYRNLKEAKIKFNKSMNFICGENAQGKTNLIEAIWMFTGARSFRGTKDAFLVAFEKDCAKLEGAFFFENREQEIKICFGEGKRSAFLNDIQQEHPTNIIGKFRAVLFSPVNLSLIKDGPENRRRFLDAAICQLKPAYTTLIARYNHTLRHRNALLKDALFQKRLIETLDVWDKKLAEYGFAILNERIKYLDLLKSKAQKIHEELSNRKEKADIIYISTAFKKTDEFTIESLKEKLQRVRASDLKTGFTSVGPHKDDIELILNGKPVKQFGSQGQQRSFALALKLAEAAVLKEKTKEAPVILLDDVMSELDESRQNYLLNKLQNFQVFITSCDETLAKKIKSGKIFKIKNGQIITENEI